MSQSKISPLYTLGISAYYHDSAAALLKGGCIVAAAHEERFTRKKHDAGFPTHAVSYVLEEAGITSTDPLTVVVNPNLARAREQLAKIAAEDYEISYQLIKQLDKKIARPILMMANIYKRYFDIMQNRGWEVISPKPQLGKIKKLSLALRAFFFR